MQQRYEMAASRARRLSSEADHVPTRCAGCMGALQSLFDRGGCIHPIWQAFDIDQTELPLFQRVVFAAKHPAGAVRRRPTFSPEFEQMQPVVHQHLFKRQRPVRKHASRFSVVAKAEHRFDNAAIVNNYGRKTPCRPARWPNA